MSHNPVDGTGEANWHCCGIQGRDGYRLNFNINISAYLYPVSQFSARLPEGVLKPLLGDAQPSHSWHT